jgi:prevent-host-death family protein
MQTVGAFEAKTHFSALLNKVEKGEQIVITKHGRIVARLIPATASSHLRIKQAISELKALSQMHHLALDWKKLRDEGRR